MKQPKTKPKKTIEKFTWRSVKMTATHTPNYLSDGWSHIELRVVTKDAPPIPITTTGYLSHFLDEEELKAAGGPAAFFLAWIERESNSKPYKRATQKWQQLELFT